MWEKHLLPYTKALRLDKRTSAHLPTPLVAMFDNYSGHTDPWLMFRLKEVRNVECVGLPPTHHTGHNP